VEEIGQEVRLGCVVTTDAAVLGQHRNLFIVRTGNKSLHQDRLRRPAPRNSHLVISYFGDDPDICRSDDVGRIGSKGPKSPLLLDYPEYMQAYDYTWP